VPRENGSHGQDPDTAMGSAELIEVGLLTGDPGFSTLSSE